MRSRELAWMDVHVDIDGWCKYLRVQEGLELLAGYELPEYDDGSTPEEYVDMVDGIEGEDDFGLYSSCPYQPADSSVLGDGCYRKNKAVSN